MLSSIKRLKRYCKVTLNVFYNKIFFDEDIKNYYYYDIFLFQIEISLLNMLKL